MADVDFSNAILEVNGNEKPLSLNNYMKANHSEFHNSSNQILNYNTWNPNVFLQNTPTKVSIQYSGTFTAGGTEFFIAYDTNAGAWHIRNVSFSAGDTYNFVIDIETSGN